MPVDQANTKWWGRTPLREERTKPSEACPNPERWSAVDDVTPEIEVLKFIRSLVRTVKPARVVTVGDPNGELTRYIGQAVRENGCGHVTACGLKDEAYDQVFGRIMGSGLSRYVDVLEAGARDTGNDLPFVVIDGDPEQVATGTVQFLQLLSIGGLCIVHDTQEIFKTRPEGYERIDLPTPRGLAIFQKK